MPTRKKNEVKKKYSRSIRPKNAPEHDTKVDTWHLLILFWSTHADHKYKHFRLNHSHAVAIAQLLELSLHKEPCETMVTHRPRDWKSQHHSSCYFFASQALPFGVVIHTWNLSKFMTPISATFSVTITFVGGNHKCNAIWTWRMLFMFYALGKLAAAKTAHHQEWHHNLTHCMRKRRIYATMTMCFHYTVHNLVAAKAHKYKRSASPLASQPFLHWHVQTVLYLHK